MAQVDWHDGLNLIQHSISENYLMWPVVKFKILLNATLDELDREPSQVVTAYFQTVPFELPLASRITMTNPLVIEGTLGIHQFQEFLQNWKDGKWALLENWSLAPPDIPFMDWHEDQAHDPVWIALLESLPIHHSTYRVAQLSGSGNENYNDISNAIWDSIHRLDLNREEWMLEYIGVNISPSLRPFFRVVLPIAVGIDASLDISDHLLRVVIHYRRPLTFDSFWVRYGTDRWEVGLSVHSFEGEAHQANGWFTSGFETEVALDPTADYIDVWIGRNPTERTFEWRVRVAIEKPRSLSQSREHFLPFWYGMVGKTLKQYIDRPLPFPAKPNNKDGAIQNHFELAIANICGALGYSVIFGGGPLSNTGIDFVAFDSDVERAYAFSVTLGNDIRHKLRTLLTVRENVSQALDNWSLCGIIVTQIPKRDLVPSDLRDAQEQSVLVMGAEELQLLIIDPPDFQQFKNLLHKFFVH